MVTRFTKWVQEKIIEPNYSVISKVIHISSSTFSYANNSFQMFVPASSTRKASYEYLVQVLEGYVQALSLSNFTNILRITPARNNFLYITSANLLLYMGSILFFEKLINKVHSYLPEDDPYYVNEAIDAFVKVLLFGMMARIYINNTAKGQSISKSIVDTRGERPVYYQKDQLASLNIQAIIASPIYYAGKLIAVDIIANLPWYLKPFTPLAFPLKMIVYGHCFIEYNIAADGMSTTQRSQILADNTAFALGMGLSFQSALWGGNYLLKNLTGIQNDFTEDAIFSCVFTYFIIVSQLMGKLPGKPGGFDLFYVNRLITEVVMKVIFDNLIFYIKKYSMKEDLIKKIKSIIYSKPFFLVEQIFLLGQKIEFLDEIEKISEIKMLLTVYEKNIREAIIEISSIRMTPYLGKALTASNYITPIIPNFILSERRLLRIIFNKNTSQVLTEFKKFMIRSRLNKLDKFYGCLLTQSDKDKISSCIDIQLQRLREGINETEDDPEIFMQKSNALYDLYDLLFQPGAESFILDIINEWKKDYYEIIHQHRSTVSQWVKQSDTALMVDEITLFLKKSLDEGVQDDFEIRDQVARLTLKRIKELQAQSEKVPGKYLTREKINSLIELDELIIDYSEKIPLRQIVLVWKEYNWHVINAHRNLSSTIMRGVSGLIKIEKNETVTAEFITTLLEDFGRLTPKKNELNKVKLFSSPPHQALEKNSAEGVNREICQLIKNKINILLAEKKNNLRNKIIALQDLIRKVEDANNITFGDLLKEWKAIHWQNITEHRPATTISTSVGAMTGYAFSFFGDYKLTQTTTANFIDSLDRIYGHIQLSNSDGINLRKY